MTTPIRLLLITLCTALFTTLCGVSTAQEPVRIAFMDPLSGGFASIGNSGLKQLQFAADYFYNSKNGILGGRKIEIVPLDNKQSPTDTQIQTRTPTKTCGKRPDPLYPVAPAPLGGIQHSSLSPS